MILVVEDHADSRSALIALLSMEGYRAVPCECGRDALAFLNDGAPELVILDYGLPDVDGLVVLRAVRSDRRLDRTRVVMFSAYDGAQREQALAAGADSYVLKGSLDWGRLLGEVHRFAGPPTNPPGARGPH
jgi:CheY-like chemotaxis protein